MIYDAVYKTETLGGQAIQRIMDSDDELKMKSGESFLVLQCCIQTFFGHTVFLKVSFKDSLKILKNRQWL